VASKPKKPTGSWILPTYGNTDCWKDFEPVYEGSSTTCKLLGKGTFGTTYLVTEKKTGQKCAIKV
jgi:calcium-dependent protein kinase